jgi:hypothetical protein
MTAFLVAGGACCRGNARVKNLPANGPPPRALAWCLPLCAPPGAPSDPRRLPGDCVPLFFFLTRVYVYILEPKSVWVRHVIFMRTARHIYAFEIKLVELYDGAIPNDLISMVDVQ